MAGRRKQRNREGWPDYLYETSGYYYWRHPVTKENFGLGRDLTKAKAQAAEANIMITGLRDQARLVDRITGNDNRTVSALLVRVVEDMTRRNLAKNTLRLKRSLINRIEEKWGSRPYSSIDTATIDEFLREFITAGKKRMAQTFRTFLIEIGNKAIAIGWSQYNPALVTEATPVQVKRARLTVDEFFIIYDSALKNCDAWTARAMELALITAQRREDIGLWVRDDVREGNLWVEQGKSENREARGEGLQTRLAIPLSLRLKLTASTGRTIDWTLKDIITGCWLDKVASRYMIHHSKQRTHSKPGDPVFKDTISKGFARARDATDLKWEGKVPPTFHEIRSLSIRLWKQSEGKDFAQAIAGHKQASTTDIYTDERGNWMMLKAS